MEDSLLFDLTKKYGSDKCANDASEQGYIPYYEKHFRSFRHKKLKILEIGVRAEIYNTNNTEREEDSPCSLKVWKDYFPNSEIYGIDIDPINADYEEDRIKIFIGNQGDEVFLNEVVDEVSSKNMEPCFDIIIDDGSHINTLTIKSWETLFPKALNRGGMYIIEDLGCSYVNFESYNLRDRWEGMQYIPEDVSFNNKRKLMDDFFEDRIERMDMSCTRWFRDFEDPEIESILFYPMICFMTKLLTPKKRDTLGRLIF